MKIYIVIQGPIINDNIYKMINSIKDCNHEVYCVISTYNNCNIEFKEDSEYKFDLLKNEIPIFPNSILMKNIRSVEGEKIIGHQIYSTYCGLEFLKNNYQIQEDDLVIKCRSDEYFNLNKFIYIIKNNENVLNTLYNINYCNIENTMSDHLFCCNFHTMYSSFSEMYRVLLYENNNDNFYPPNCIEKTIYYYLNKYGNFSKKIIECDEISPCCFVMNHQNKKKEIL